MKPKIVIKFDKEKDLWNIWDTCNAKSSYGYSWKNSVTPNIFEICHNKKYEKCKKELAKTMRYLYLNPLTKMVAKDIENNWSKISKEYFKRLEKITKRKFPIKKLDVYLTTTTRCPYNPNKKNPSFYVHFFSNTPDALHTMGHELMHIHLHRIDWWKKVENELGREKTNDLKEALTVLLNLEFEDLWIAEDKGYPNHEKLRKYISQQWKKRKDFDKLTGNCIVWIKKNGVKWK